MKKLVLLFALSSLFGFGQFTEQNPLDASITNQESFIADFDGDGFNDIVYHNENGIQWRSNADGEGTFHIIHQVYVIDSENIEEWIISIAPADLDGDGDIDIAFGTQGVEGPGVAWTENIGDGEFAGAITLLPDVSLRRIYSEDIDGDSDLDLIVNTVGGPDIDFTRRLLVLENIGDALFEAPLVIDEFGLAEKKSNMGDVDDDGDIDFMVGVEGSNEIRIYENLGGMTFSTGTVVAIASDYIYEIHPNDVDEDGDLDIVYVVPIDDHISWVENEGGGIFGDSHLIHTSHFPYKFRFGDFDGDDDMDILFLSREDDDMSPGTLLRLLEKTGPDEFTELDTLADSYSTYVSMSTGNIDLDGDLDIVFKAPGYCQSAYLTNEGGLTFSDPVIFSCQTSGIKQIINEDISGNGLPDVISIGVNPGNIVWFENEGDGQFGPSKTIIDALYGMQYLITVDVDSDDDLDLIVSNTNDSTIFWVENLGGGVFGSLISINTDVISRQLLPIDLNADGNMDFISIGNWDAETIDYYENLGGSYGSPSEITAPNEIIFANVADIDSDDDDDLIINTQTGLGKFLWLENTGGSFATEAELATNRCTHFTISDLNNDGELDIVGVNYSDFSPELYWHENLGSMVFDDELILMTEFMNPKEVYASDLNGDGNQDLVVGGFFGIDDDVLFVEETGRVAWLENTGDALFNPPSVITDELAGFNTITIADNDADGDDDIFSVSLYDNELTWFKNGFITPQQVKGNLFYDENENGIRDLSEVGLGGIQVESDPLGDFSYTYDNGDYILNFEDAPDGDYTIFPQELDHWMITTAPDEYDITVDDLFTGATDMDFGFFPSDDETEVTGSVIGTFPRCNTNIHYYLTYENIGGSIAQGIIELELNENILYVDADILPDSVVDNTCYWSFEDLFFFDEQIIQLTVEMPSADFLGDTLTSYSTVTALDDFDVVLFTHEDSISQELRCAYDPNDKTVWPKGAGDFGDIPQSTPYLEYTVRFQNTGNDTAINVVIKDHLDENLDWGSLELLGNSHPMEVYLGHTGEISFSFNNIMLPDSNVNELASHGFVKYRIDLLPMTDIGTVITNTARIYFDANPAIVTNTTINRIAEDDDVIDDSGIEETEPSSILVYPNPFHESTTIYFGESLGKDLTIQIFDVLGNQVYYKSEITESLHTLSSSELGSGVYILTVTAAHSNKGVQTTRLVVQ